VGEAGIRAHAQPRLPSEKRFQPRIDIMHSMARGRDHRLQIHRIQAVETVRRGVSDFNEGSVFAAGMCPHLDANRLARPSRAMDDGMFEQRLQAEARHKNASDSGRGVEAQVEAVAQAQPLDFAIGARHVHFAFERVEHRLIAREDGPQRGGEQFDSAFGAGRVGRDQRRDRVQCVEEKMRIDLCAQSGQARRLGQLFHSASLVFAPHADAVELLRYRQGHSGNWEKQSPSGRLNEIAHDVERMRPALHNQRSRGQREEKG